MITDDKIIELFCKIDDFMKEYEQTISSNSLPEPNLIKRRNRKSKLSASEVMTILVLFHLKSYRNLKHFYLTVFASIHVIYFQKFFLIIDL